MLLMRILPSLPLPSLARSTEYEKNALFCAHCSSCHSDPWHICLYHLFDAMARHATLAILLNDICQHKAISRAREIIKG